MAAYDIDVVVGSQPPSLFVSVDIGTTHVPTARNAGGDWEGKVKKANLTLPVTLHFIGRGVPNQPYAVAVTLTPQDGSPAVNFKTKNKKLDNEGFDRFETPITKS